MFNLKFAPERITEFSKRYYDPLESIVEDNVSPLAKKRGYLTKDDLKNICRWKTPRTKAHILKNSNKFIEESTKVSFSTCSEELRIKVLTLLQGVSWPTASVVLHFCHERKYPILDFRALWSLGIDTPPKQYEFSFWIQYVYYCRKVAERNSVSMRNLDRALWQYSKENQ